MKMKRIKYFLSLLVLVAFVTGCSVDKFEDLSSVQTLTTPSKVASLFDITNDNTGKVTITPSGEGTGSYDVYFGDGTAAPANVQSGDNVSHNFKEGNYTVKIVAKGLNGVNTEKTYPLVILYRAPENLAVTLSQAGVNLKVKATALYAASYLVYYGDVVNEVGTPLATGEELSHEYASIGTYDVKVVALSGGAAKIEKIITIKVTVPFVFPIDFENPNVNYFFGTFDDWGQQKFSTVANPSVSGINTSANVGQYTSGHAGWSGTYSPLEGPIDFANGNKVKVWVYNPDPANIGKKLNVELESGSIANGIAVLKVAFTTSGAWEELVFDFSTISGIPSNAKFNQLVLRFDDGHSGGGAVFYVDNFRFTN